MSTEILKLKNRLDEMHIRILGITPGTNPNVTPEEIAREINKSLDQIEAGDFEEVL